jgi:small ligand-binding sensory domain FIST
VRFASVLGTDPDTRSALRDAIEQLQTALPSVDLVLAFASPHHHVPGAPSVPQGLAEAFPGAMVVGCQGGGVLASGVELEGSPGLAVLGAHLPDVQLHPVHLDRALIDGPEDLARAIDDAFGDTPLAAVFVWSDPFTFDLSSLVPVLTAAHPGVPIVGGQASGSSAPGPHPLYVDGKVAHGGALLLGLSGNVRVDTVVAQGCRPVGPPMFVTRCEGNLLLELDGGDPVRAVKEVYESLEPADQSLFRQGQYLGLQMREQTEYDAGDFLIRHLLGVPEDGRGLAIAAPLKLYDVVQLHVRDGASARDELLGRLGAYDGPKPAGALLVSCLGRGRGLYGEAHHDSRALQSELGPTAVAGFFANGEVGPVDGVPYVHGYTSVFALFSTPGGDDG